MLLANWRTEIHPTYVNEQTYTVMYVHFEPQGGGFTHFKVTDDLEENVTVKSTNIFLFFW